MIVYNGTEILQITNFTKICIDQYDNDECTITVDDKECIDAPDRAVAEHWIHLIFLALKDGQAALDLLNSEPAGSVFVYNPQNYVWPKKKEENI